MKKWFLRISLTFIIVISVWLATLAYPHPFFQYNKTYGNLTLYSDMIISPEIDSVMTDVQNRINLIEVYDPETEIDIFYCSSRKLFSFFARISLQKPSIQGYNLSIFNNCYISLARINDMKWEYPYTPKYSIWEASRGHIIAHEIAHQYCSDKSGYLSYRKIPYSKIEGYIEYMVNKYHFKKDQITLKNRIDIYRNLTLWSQYNNHARNEYNWALITEFLITQDNLSYTEFVSDSVILESSYEQMMDWFREQ